MGGVAPPGGDHAGLGPRGRMRQWIWTAELGDGGVVGQLRAHEFDDAVDGAGLPGCVTVPKGTVVLDGVVVSPDWRRRGIGTRLVDALRNEVTSAVVAMTASPAGQDFLLAYGFGPTRALPAPRWLVSRAVG